MVMSSTSCRQRFMSRIWQHKWSNRSTMDKQITRFVSHRLMHKHILHVHFTMRTNCERTALAVPVWILCIVLIIIIYDEAASSRRFASSHSHSSYARYRCDTIQLVRIFYLCNNDINNNNIKSIKYVAFFGCRMKAL